MAGIRRMVVESPPGAWRLLISGSRGRGSTAITDAPSERVTHSPRGWGVTLMPSTADRDPGTSMGAATAGTDWNVLMTGACRAVEPAADRGVVLRPVRPDGFASGGGRRSAGIAARRGW